MIRNNTLLRIVLIMAFLITNSIVITANAEDPAGKKIFVASKCNSCHAVESQAIKKTLASSKAPDLSNVGADHKADWLIRYLKKEEDKKNKKHAKAWTGKSEDLTSLAQWLETLKTAAAEKK